MLKRSLLTNGEGRKKLDLATLFILTISISAVIFFIIHLIIGNGRFAEAFFNRSADFFMDFFNSIRDASQGSAVYTERKVIYPPMANLIYLVFSRFTPDIYNNTSFIDRYQWTQHFSPMTLMLLYAIASAFLFFFVTYSSFRRGSELKRFAFTFFAFFSLPVLFMAERGNMIMISLIAMMLYAFTYNSDKRLYREIGLIALAFAFSLKLYPVVFGWFLIKDKRYKDAARCALYGVLMILIPSFFFGGPACIITMLQNIFSFSTGERSTLSIILDTARIPDLAQTVLTVLIYVWVVICGCCFAVSPFIKCERWESWMLGISTILCIPSLTSLYSWAFLLIPMIMLCNKQKEDIGKKQVFYMIVMMIPFIFPPFGSISFNITHSTVLVYAMSAVMSISAVVGALKRAAQMRRKA